MKAYNPPPTHNKKSHISHKHTNSVNMAESPVINNLENIILLGGSSTNSYRNNSTDICPCCRSSRGEFNETDRNFTMCSQKEQPSSSSSATTTNNYQSCCGSSSSSSCMSSPNTHLRSYCLNSSNKNSQLPKCTVSDGSCRCAKNVTSRKTPSTTSTSRARYCSPIDGWRVARFVLLGILFILPSSIMSSPVNHRQSRSPSPHSSSRSHHHSPHRASDRPMKWINPCRIPKSMPTQQAEITMPSQSDEEIFQNIVTQAKKAEVQARQFFADFREECFGNTGHDYQQLHYDWLKDIAEKVGKNLGEPVGQARLETLEVEDILKSMYRGLQKLAVGLEQVVLDQAIHGGSFAMHFHEAEFQLKYVLCEFQIAMMEKNIQYEDVTRDIMDKDFVNLEDKTWRNLRDFSIFRDYLNTLEFIKESFEHFWKVAKQSS